MDNCLDQLVPSDLRLLVGERDVLAAKVAALEEIAGAVAHIGTDFGYGPYELEDKWVKRSRGYFHPPALQEG